MNTAKATLAAAEAGLSAAIDDAGEQAGQPGNGGTADIDPAAIDAVDTARNQLDQAKATAAPPRATCHSGPSAPTRACSTKNAN